MELRVLGCHGASTPKHRTSCFLVDDNLVIDAGALTDTLAVAEQNKIETVLVSHTHLDHIRDLGFLIDNRFQMGTTGVEVAAIPETLNVLRQHVFNGKLWPDFSQMNSVMMADGKPLLRFRELVPGEFAEFESFRVKPVLVNHTIDASAFIVEKNNIALAYTGDTGPTDQLWRELNAQKNLGALIVETSFPNAQDELATLSKHYTPQTMEHDLQKLKRADEIELLIFHIKPAFEKAVLQDLAEVRLGRCQVLQLDERRKISA